MCAVIGAIISNPSLKDFENLKRVFHESKIRGMHATGLAYIKDGKVHIDKKPVPAHQFSYDFPSYVNEDGNLYLIGHCRYSTSDLEYNQPIGNDGVAIVHNGVITQELPQHWKEKYGYDCETKNDSELVLHSEDPLTEFSNMSMAVCELVAKDKHLHLYRNGKRPLYLTNLLNGSIITSTADIAERAGLNFPTMEVPMNVYVTFDSALTMSLHRLEIPGAVDYQHENINY